MVDGTARGKNKNRFFVRSVAVDGGAVTVRTGGYPDAGASTAGRGACNWIAGAETWMKSISVKDQGGATTATWKSGDKSCKAGTSR